LSLMSTHPPARARGRSAGCRSLLRPPSRPHPPLARTSEACGPDP
jgi:hypothetical protein